MDIGQLVNITSRAWALPILASLHDGVPGRQAKLLAATGASRTAFAQSLAHLIKAGLLERNPGHGHPLRPEFRLTGPGREAAALAAQVQAATPDREDKALIRRNWTLPVLTTLQQPLRFGEIRQSLPPITDRALSQSLRQMEQRAWISRQVSTETRPPIPVYHAVGTGHLLSRIAAP